MVADRIIFNLSKSTYILLVLAQWPHLVPKMTCIIIFLYFQRIISMYESRAVGTTRAFSVELGKHIKRTEYSDVRILCKLESHPINLSHSFRHLNIFSVVAFITVLHWCGSHISTDYNSPLIRSEFMKMELSWKHTLYLPSVFR